MKSHSEPLLVSSLGRFLHWPNVRFVRSAKTSTRLGDASAKQQVDALEVIVVPDAQQKQKDASKPHHCDAKRVSTSKHSCVTHRKHNDEVMSVGSSGDDSETLSLLSGNSTFSLDSTVASVHSRKSQTTVEVTKFELRSATTPAGTPGFHASEDFRHFDLAESSSTVSAERGSGSPVASSVEVVGPHVLEVGPQHVLGHAYEIGLLELEEGWDGLVRRMNKCGASSRDFCTPDLRVALEASLLPNLWIQFAADDSGPEEMQVEEGWDGLVVWPKRIPRAILPLRPFAAVRPDRHQHSSLRRAPLGIMSL